MKKLFISCALFLLFCELSSLCYAESFKWDVFNSPYQRYGQMDALRIADNIVLLQRDTGGWGKGLSPVKTPTKVELALEKGYELAFDKADAKSYSHRASSLDNGATHTHIRYLLRAAKATNEEKYKAGALRGINYLLAAQTPTGGWPQNYPNISSFGGQVTFNDGAMVGAMTAIKEAASGDYDFIDSATRNQAELAFLRGVDFILQSQIVIDGVKTAWCAQHDRNDFRPVGGRTYELPSISGAESVGVVKLLMSIDQPNESIKQSIVAAVDWLRKASIKDVELKKVYAPQFKENISLMIKEDPASTAVPRVFKGRGYDNILVNKNGVKPIWARFYDIDTQRPFFVGWDGVKKFSIDQIDIERRTGYRWYGYWPEGLLKSEWPKWEKKYL